MSSKKIIAVDLDDVLSANAEGFINFSNERFGTKLKPRDFHEDLEKLWGVDHDEVIRRMKEFTDSEIVRDYEHNKEAVPALKNLVYSYNLILVTSRREVLMRATKEWIDEKFPNIFNSIHHSKIFDGNVRGSHHMTKAQICLDLGADYLIDDQIKHCNAVAEVGIESLLFGEFGWNKSGKLHPQVTRVKTWEEIKDYFNAKAGR